MPVVPTTPETEVGDCVNQEFRANLGNIVRLCLKSKKEGLAWWYMSVNPATQEVQIRTIEVRGQPRQKISKTPISTN
jgi:hypothetical protein